ncbi:threonine/serine exporter family protein [Bombilactobacillus thymidiniphilus]|uniref:Threonine/serine exporter family protein n=1 Tax=Bombilactobacillus thymidiniphilus TaxID=2923363 RepID=A0ABY4PFH0_9LACO|nr:threonine/serine exporter family protein [Bombilactobacillus thymidiniphilus]UQS84238.1 threonine/serine exporter family protein [Bombilactobacillus thymidiniphilus]
MTILYHLLVQIILSFVGTIAFGLFIQVRKQELIWAGLSGCIGWMTYWLLVQISVGKIPANFIAALVVGIVGSILARIRRQPSTVFNIPGLVPLVPGASAYQALELFFNKKEATALTQIFHVVLLTGAIALGYVCAQVLSELLAKYKNK